MSARYEFIVNPQARSGRGKKIWERMEPELKRRKIDFDVYITEKKGHAGEIAGRLSGPGQQRTIVVLGGDGTVNGVINGLNVSENITLGYIPVGSGNDFARGLGIPEKPEKALGAVLSPAKIVRMDVGILSDGTRTRRFGVSGGMGFDAAVCHAVSVSRWKRILNRIHLGKLTYAVVAVGTLLRNKPVRVELVREDGEKQVFDRMVFAAFMNLPCEGGGFRFCPDAAPDDGVLDVFLVSGIPKIKILFLLPSAYLGGRLNYHGVTRIRCRNLQITAGNSVTVHTDGETETGWEKAEVRLLDKKLKVIAG